MELSHVEVRSILTRTGGFLEGVASHSLQPYRGCSYGRSLCGVGCYVQHSRYVTAGRAWGSFLEVRDNAAEVYRRQYARERAWGRKTAGRFGVFCSSATDPFVPQERIHGVTRSILEAMVECPPDRLILQSHSPDIARHADVLTKLSGLGEVRAHVSVETDRETFAGMPPPVATAERRLEAAAALKAAGIRTIITVAPLLPIADPRRFFEQIAEVADAVVIDHFIGGDGTANGARTRRTLLPILMEAALPGSATLRYREKIVAVARAVMPGRVGVGSTGFAGNWT